MRFIYTLLFIVIKSGLLIRIFMYPAPDCLLLSSSVFKLISFRNKIKLISHTARVMRFIVENALLLQFIEIDIIIKIYGMNIIVSVPNHSRRLPS